MAQIELANVRKEYPLGKTRVVALDGVECSIPSGAFLSVRGPSGSGKSTLLNLLGLIDNPTSGEIRYDGLRLDSERDSVLTRYRLEHIGFIFQSFNLIPILNVQENIEYPLMGSEMTSKARTERVGELLDRVGLDGLGRRFPNELSGGQRQRVAIARALVRHPSTVLADEPTANLDSETGGMIIDILHGLNKDLGATIIMATHDEMIIGRSDQVFELHDGRFR